jgi:meso-butanediol dehydrogenase/(S,S)-butanediol dehydrogenase/diacetyl reductase
MQYQPIAGRFTNKIVIVTGAGSGIGEATARRFSAEGAMLMLTGRHKSKLERVARDLPKDRTKTRPCDVSRLPEVRRLVQATMREFGQIDVLINNAGVAVGGDIAEMKPADWNRVMETNARGVFNGCAAALPYLVKFRGCVVNTASVSGLRGDWGMCVYDASKGAVVNLTRALALDYGNRGVRINSVCPTLTRTPLAGDILKNKKAMAKFQERIALGRIGEPEDIAAVITFLASPDAAFITGVNFPVDGGVTASNGQANS